MTHLVNTRVAFIASDVGNVAISLLNFVLKLIFVRDLGLECVLCSLVVCSPAILLLSAPGVMIDVDLSLFLCESLRVNYLLLHALDEAFEGVELRSGLHLAQLAHRGLLVLQLRERAVHRSFYVVFYQACSI